MNPKDMKIRYEYPMFTDHIAPNGFLTYDVRSHACFYYGMLAMKARAGVGSGIDSQIIEYKVGETPPEWRESRDEELARSVAIIYNLESPDEFLKFKKEAWAQMQALGIIAPPEIFEVRPGAPKIH